MTEREQHDEREACSSAQPADPPGLRQGKGEEHEKEGGEQSAGAIGAVSTSGRPVTSGRRTAGVDLLSGGVGRVGGVHVIHGTHHSRPATVR